MPRESNRIARSLVARARVMAPLNGESDYNYCSSLSGGSLADDPSVLNPSPLAIIFVGIPGWGTRLQLVVHSSRG